MKLSVLGTVFLSLATLLPGQIILPPGYSVVSTTTATTLGIPGPLGGIEFSLDGQTLYCGGAANSGTAAVYAIPLTRHPVTNQITAFGTATYFAEAFRIDGGLAFGPSGTLFFTTYSDNQLGQITGAGTSYFPLPIESASTGGCAFVPASLRNGGDLLVSSYSNGSIFTVPLTPNGNGTFTPGAATLFAALPGGSEGFRYIPSGSLAGRIMFTNYGIGTISMLDINPATGEPVGGAASPSYATFASGIVGAEGLVFDPLTNDFFVSTYNGSPSNSLIHITGFPVPQWSLSAPTPTVPLSGGVRNLLIQAGPTGANREYIVLGGVSGSSPGLVVAFLSLPLNLDIFTELMYPLVNTPLFDNFQGITDANGDALLTMNIPPIPAVSLGATVTFAGIFMNPINATSVATTLTIVP